MNALRFLSAAALALPLLGGCVGYQFPGQRGAALPADTRLEITGPGAENYPLYARMLRDKLQRRLGLGSSENQGAPRLEIRLQSLEAVRLREDQSGRGDRFRLTFSAQPLWHGGPETRYQSVTGSATYAEPGVASASQSLRRQTEGEALEELARNLAARLSLESGAAPP
ncbi:MAG: hypothetical protein H7831_05540 [Magnetococcus sp. WYHC-3]